MAVSSAALAILFPRIREVSAAAFSAVEVSFPRLQGPRIAQNDPRRIGSFVIVGRSFAAGAFAPAHRAFGEPDDNHPPPVVTPKLVSNGATSGRLISRSSIRSIFIIILKEQILAVLAFASGNETGTIESLPKEVPGNRRESCAAISRLVKTAGLDLSISRGTSTTAGWVSSIFAFKRAGNALRADPPFHKEAIRIETAMERARARVAVVVL